MRSAGVLAPISPALTIHLTDPNTIVVLAVAFPIGFGPVANQLRPPHDKLVGL